MSTLDDWQPQQQQDEEQRRNEVEVVLIDYLYGRTNVRGFTILCEECGIHPKLLKRAIEGQHD